MANTSSTVPPSTPTDPNFSPLVMTGLQYYAENSTLPPSLDIMLAARPYSWATIGLGVGVLLHSAIIHRNKYPVIRILTELCALGVLLTGVFQILGTCSIFKVLAPVYLI